MPCKKFESGLTVEQVIELFDWYKEFSKIYIDYLNKYTETYGIHVILPPDPEILQFIESLNKS